MPAEVVEAVRNQLTVHKVHDMKKVTRALVRKYLRDLKHIKVTRKDGTTYITEGPKFYKHTSQIAQRISGRQEVVIPPWITRKIRQMFSVIGMCVCDERIASRTVPAGPDPVSSLAEVAFDEIRPEYRKNFSNYAPVINHLLELLDDPEADRLMRFFPKLKSKDKHLDQVGRCGACIFTGSKTSVDSRHGFPAGGLVGEGMQPCTMAVSAPFCICCRFDSPTSNQHFS